MDALECPRGIGTEDPSLGKSVRGSTQRQSLVVVVGRACDVGSAPLQTSAGPLVCRSQTAPEAVVCEGPGQPSMAATKPGEL